MANKDKGKEIWISYVDDTGAEVKGFFLLLDIQANYVKIKSKSSNNVLILPFHKVNKIKERTEEV